MGFSSAAVQKEVHMADTSHNTDFVAMASEIVSAYVANQSVSSGDLASLIRDVHTALQQAAHGRSQPEPEPQQPAVPVKKSVRPDAIVCLEDGKGFKSLKRHLRTDHNLSPEEYRTKWGLPRDYPMVAPNYAKSRSELAKSMGLGRKGAPEPAEVRAPAGEQTPAQATKRRKGAKAAA